jgi:histidinol-phosphate aminotransferase
MDQPAGLRFKPTVAAAPIFTSDPAIETAQQQFGLTELIKIGSNESPYGPSPLAIAAVQQAATGLNRYPPMGDEDLRAAVAETIGHGLEPDNIVTGNGGCDVLAMIANSFVEPGAEVIICRPTFPVYELTTRRVGAQIVYVDLGPEQFRYDVEAILAAVTEQTRLIYICSPNNPTGSTITPPQMETLVDSVPPHVLIVADEVYHHFAPAAALPDTLAYVKAGRNVVIIHSFSKAYALAGLRLGYAIAPVEIARYLSRARESFHLSSVAVVAALAGLKDTAHLAGSVAKIIAGRDYLVDALSQLELQVWPSQGNFVLFKPPFPPTDISERLLRRGLIVRPMTQFYLPTHMRVTVGLPAENERFVTALDDVLTELEAEGVSRNVTVEASGGEFKF